ncbi:hypothetical protein PHJA_002863700 [Phtheirospermum japonicum]|uniref:Uncharacterized protein n=1 Tax=Phtheirospermum japonicum TaxID=374723 RepID=A0A830DK62_9LAMI|nr:hypothetical protein PHJA_002863700 [Phtheirospermum japonicum]
MERPLTLKPLSIQDENSAIHRKKAAVDSKFKTSKPVADKGGVALKSRKALNDITNKSSIPSQKKNSQIKKSNTVEERHLRHRGSEAETVSKKKSSINEKLNIAEEGFLHDHNKCIEAQKTAHELNFWDTVFPGHVRIKKSDADVDSISRHPKLEELSMSAEFSDWFESNWKSPPSSPVRSDSSLFSWALEPFELMLKEDHCGDV